MNKIAIAAVVLLSLAFVLQDFARPSFVPGEVPSPPPRAAEWDRIAMHAVPLIAKWEGKRNEAYLDTIARPPVWTICYGHTITAEPGMVLTDAQCEQLLNEESEQYWWGVREAFSEVTILTRMPPTRGAAYTSFAYNVGVTGASRSTAVRRLNAGNVVGACEALGWWNKAGGRVIRGLVNRRADETKMCLIGTNTSV